MTFKQWRTISLLVLLLTCGSLNLHAQYPQYDPPLDGPLLVTGTFGELRSNHFHAGLDFRARIGTPVKSVAAGYVSRIRITAGSYGQAVYVDHPGGYRSVYGHLDALAPELLDTLRARQYAEKTFAITLYFEPGDFPVSAGQLIGRVGNRGFSFGPHLHFEMRDAATDRAINPLHFGFSVPDRRKPELRRLLVYELDEQSRTLRQHEIPLRLGRSGDYQAEGGELVVGQPLLGLAIKAYDQQDAMPNYNGIYAARLWVDSTRLHAFRFDAVGFDETRYLNAHTDFREWTENKSWFHRLFRLPGDSLSIYAPSEYHGQFRLPANESSRLLVEVDDFAGNRSTVILDVRHEPRARPPGSSYQYEFLRDEGNLLRLSDVEFELPPEAIYTDLRLRYARARDESRGVYSAVHHLHEAEVPLHLPGELRLRPDPSLPDSLRPYAVIAHCPPGGQVQSLGGSWRGDWLVASIRQFGSYCLLVDREAPVVQNIDFRRSMQNRESFTLLVEERFGGEASSSGFRYHAEVDGQWVLMEHDAKSGKLTHVFDGRIPRGDHEFTLQVWDERGNKTSYQAVFTR